MHTHRSAQSNRPSPTRILLFHVLLTCLWTSAGAGQQPQVSPHPASSDSFAQAVARIRECSDTAARTRLVEDLLAFLKRRGQPVTGDSTVWFVYGGSAAAVSIAGDFNGWRPALDWMTRINGTDLFYLEKKFDPASRFEYKLVVDGRWTLDPLNNREAIGGFGSNSEIWMPRYVPPGEITYRPHVPHGTLDTISISSRHLGRTYPVYVYLPPDRATSARTGKSREGSLPVVFVMDGGEYLSLARMNTVLDNLIADRRIPPIGAVFVDPRLDPRNPATSTRFLDYTMSDSFLTALVQDFRDRLAARYGFSKDPRLTGIMGASLGGLAATYAAIRRPDVFGLSAAQSPAYGWNSEAILRIVSISPRTATLFYVDTGTMRDAEAPARRMRDALLARGFALRYGEYPEGHNWVNWRARIDDILEFFYRK